MAIRVGINGFGRIGRLVFRRLMEKPKVFEVVGINDITDTKTLAYLLKYDSIHRRFPGEVGHDDQNIIVATARRSGRWPSRTRPRCPGRNWAWTWCWRAPAFSPPAAAAASPAMPRHLDAGARKVVLSAPAKDEPDLTCVLGVNDDQLKPEHNCISNASCTTNCLAPVAKVLAREVRHRQGADDHHPLLHQRSAGVGHAAQGPLSRRAAALNIIPTTTGAAKAVGLVIPALKGKMTGISLRVPMPTGSVVDLTVEMASPVTKDAVNAAMKEAAAGPLKGILKYTEDAIVSSDVIGDSHSSIFAGDLTMVMGDNLLKVVSWYDNEWGYSCRSVDLIEKIGKL